MSTATLIQRPVQTAARPGRPGRAGALRRRRSVALRRRMAAVATVAAIVVLVLGAAWAVRSHAAPDTGVFEATVVVAPGETVWDIARRYVPDGQHPQAYVAEVLRYNAVDATSLAPGTVLRLPRP